MKSEGHVGGLGFSANGMSVRCRRDPRPQATHPGGAEANRQIGNSARNGIEKYTTFMRGCQCPLKTGGAPGSISSEAVMPGSMRGAGSHHWRRAGGVERADPALGRRGPRATGADGAHADRRLQ